MLTYTSKQADKARSSNHFRNKDKPFNPYYIIHWIQLISSKVTPESKIVSALHFIYSYEGITGNQDSVLIPSLSYNGYETAAHFLLWRHHLNHDQVLPPPVIYEKKLFQSDFIFYLISAARHQNLRQLHWAVAPFSVLKSWKC